MHGKFCENKRVKAEKSMLTYNDLYTDQFCFYEYGVTASLRLTTITEMGGYRLLVFVVNYWLEIKL